MSKDIYKKITGLYKNKVLIPEIGDGKLTNKLLKDLEEILLYVKFPEETVLDESRVFLLLNKQIDYPSLYKPLNETHSNRRGYKQQATLIQNCLLRLGIKTYGDLARKYYEWAQEKGDLGYESFFRLFKSIGPKTSDLLMKHLESVGFQFTMDYAHKVSLVKKLE